MLFNGLDVSNPNVFIINLLAYIQCRFSLNLIIPTGRLSNNNVMSLSILFKKSILNAQLKNLLQ